MKTLGEGIDFPNLLPHLDDCHADSKLWNLRCFREHEDPESHLQSQDTTTSNIITTTAEEEYAGPMVEGLSIHTITEEEDSTTTPPTRHCQQGEEAKTWTCVPLLQRVSSSNEAERSQDWNPLHHRAKGGTHRTVKRVPRDLRLVLPRHARPRHRHSGPQDSAEARMQARQTSTAPNEARTNIVPVPKKDGKVRMCVDYRDLNRASPKDNFPLPHIDTLVDNTATNAVFSFMDGFSGYNQIKDGRRRQVQDLLSSHIGEPFVYDVMPFGLKNAGATYQRAMVTLFHDMIHHEIEVYVDDMIAKSRTAQDHLTDLRKLFQRLKKYQLRLNPNKCAFGVTSGKLLGFIVSGRGIEIDPAKVQAIRSMPAPKTEKEIRSFLGRINYIARFIAQLTATCEPLFKLLRKDDVPSFLYLTVQEASMGCMLGQQDETGKKEQAIYYLSKKFTEPETRYLLVEKTCCALAWASKKLRQYMLYYTTWLFDILFVARKAIKGQAIADYLADYPSEQLELMDSEFPDEDVMTVDEDNHGSWGFDCTNNMTEYEACIVGLQAALEFGAYELEVFGDSLLIVSQTNGEWQARDPKLIPYQRYISRLVPKFKYVTFTYTPRAHNHFADALATLASLIKLVEGDDVRPLRIETRDIPAYCVCIEECMNVEAEIDNKPWYYDIKRFIQDREYPPRATENEKKYIRRMAFQFFLSGEILYKRTHDATLLRYYESWLLLVDNGEGLHQTCPDVPQMPDVSEQQERTSPISSHYGLAVAILSLGNGCDSVRLPQRRLTGMKFILVAIDYFTKNAHHRQCFQPEQPHDGSAMPAVQDPAPQLCAPYRPKMNGAVEAANKNVKKILSKMTETYKDWHEHLPYAFVCLPNVSEDILLEPPPYSLKPEWAQARYEQLNFIDEKRLAALCHGQLYQRRIERAYNKKARPRTFQPGDLVLKKRNMALSDPRGKFAPSYEGPYVVKKAFSGGAIILADMDGEEFRPGKQRKSVRTLPSDGNYHGYGENLGRGAIGKSNVESWTWRKLRVSLQNLPKAVERAGSPSSCSSKTARALAPKESITWINLMKSCDHRETLLVEPRSIQTQERHAPSPTQSARLRCHPGER
uniref:Reverse transcriptase domain-containing protein n=1 Tax=Fagus sylvatica TaxID=28930 RepID=A0A2N9F6E3_FAGSY